MKRVILIGCIFLISLSSYLFQSYLLKQKTLSLFEQDHKRITMYSQWGYDTASFEKLYTSLKNEVKATTFVMMPFQSQSFMGKHDNILRLTQAGYATEVAKQKSAVQSRLTYLRDRVKENTVLSQKRKQVYFDLFEVIAGSVFESNIDLKGLKTAQISLTKHDFELTKEVESLRKESLIGELKSYKATCEELVAYFTKKESESNLELSRSCVSAADKLLQPEYTVNGADFIETLSRERVFTAMQKASMAKQQLIQDEQYALAVKKKEEERLTVVPPAPRQEGKIVVVNLGLQRLYAYENGLTLFPTAVPITTGKQGFETVTGEFAIYLKEQQHKMVSPFPGIYYDDVVNYWMPFYLGYGLHDAPWRGVYGTQDYGIVGSHGCVNIPFKETSILYNWAVVGTRVIVL